VYIQIKRLNPVHLPAHGNSLEVAAAVTVAHAFLFISRSAVQPPHPV
jgi:hypothetical protein